MITRWHDWRYKRLMAKFDRLIEREIRWLQDFERRTFLVN